MTIHSLYESVPGVRLHNSNRTETAKRTAVLIPAQPHTPARFLGCIAILKVHLNSDGMEKNRERFLRNAGRCIPYREINPYEKNVSGLKTLFLNAG